MLRKLQDDASSHVLFTVKNLPLSIFVVRWLAGRIKGHTKQSKLLARLHLLFEPLGDGPRVASVTDGRIEM